MKFAADRAPLLAALSALQSVIDRKGTIPILANVHLSATPSGHLALRGTNLDMEASTTVITPVCNGPATTVNFEKLLSVVQSLPDGADLVFDGESDPRAKLKSGRSVFQLPQLPPESFPVLDMGMLDASFTLPAASLLRLLTIGSVAMEDDGARPYLQCVYLHTQDDQIRAVSTDGKALTLVHAPRPDGLADFAVSIAPKTVAAAIKMLSGLADAPIEVGLAEGKMSLGAGPARLVSRLLGQEQEYPKYARLIPAERAGEIRVDTDLFLGALGRALVMSDGGTNAYRVKMLAEDGTLAFTARGADAGEADDEIECAVTGEGYDIAFNGARMREIAGLVKCEEFMIRYADSTRPMIITEGDDADWLALLVPMAV